MLVSISEGHSDWLVHLLLVRAKDRGIIDRSFMATSSLCRRETASKMNVARRAADVDLEFAGGYDPFLQDDIPDADILYPQVQADSLALAWVEEDALKATEDLGGLPCGLGEAEV